MTLRMKEPPFGTFADDVERVMVDGVATTLPPPPPPPPPPIDVEPPPPQPGTKRKSDINEASKANPNLLRFTKSGERQNNTTKHARGPDQIPRPENRGRAQACARIAVGTGPPDGAIEEIVAVNVAGAPFRLTVGGAKVKVIPEGAGPAVSVTVLGIFEAGVTETETD
jgi:hypothetical protein